MSIRPIPRKESRSILRDGRHPSRDAVVWEEELRPSSEDLRRARHRKHQAAIRIGHSSPSATIHNADRTREVLNGQVVPGISGAPGFKTGYWTWSSGNAGLNGLSMIIFDSEENARAAGDRISAIAADAPDDVTLDDVEVREVVASA